MSKSFCLWFCIRSTIDSLFNYVATLLGDFENWILVMAMDSCNFFIDDGTSLVLCRIREICFGLGSLLSWMAFFRNLVAIVVVWLYSLVQIVWWPVLSMFLSDNVRLFDRMILSLLRLCLIASLASTQFCTVKIQFNWISILFWILESYVHACCLDSRLVELGTFSVCM